MRAPVSRSRHFLCRSSGLLVLHEPLVGDLGLFGELLLGCSHGAIDRRDPGGGLGVSRGAGFEFELAELVGGQGGLLVGVVLATGEHAPEQDRQLAGAGDDRFAVPAPSSGSFVEGVQRTGLADRGSCGARPAPSAPMPSRALRSGRCVLGFRRIGGPSDPSPGRRRACGS
jgi:hypothetical protein